MKFQSPEIWTDIPGYEGLYRVSNYGHVMSCHGSGRLLKPIPKNNGYLCVNLYQNQVMKQNLVHRLVMLAFVGPSELQVNHRDGDKTNNNLANLEYVTPQQNLIHAVRTRLIPTKLSVSDVQAIKQRHAQKESVQALARRFDVDPKSIRDIVNRIWWKHVE